LARARINATPGGLTFGELVNAEALVLSAFDADDPIKDHLGDAMKKFGQSGTLKPTVIEVRSIDEMVIALNFFLWCSSNFRRSWRTY
jgi:hypothetical protein